MLAQKITFLNFGFYVLVNIKIVRFTRAQRRENGLYGHYQIPNK